MALADGKSQILDTRFCTRRCGNCSRIRRGRSVSGEAAPARGTRDDHWPGYDGGRFVGAGDLARSTESIGQSITECVNSPRADYVPSVSVCVSGFAQAGPDREQPTGCSAEKQPVTWHGLRARFFFMSPRWRFVLAGVGVILVSALAFVWSGFQPTAQTRCCTHLVEQRWGQSHRRVKTRRLTAKVWS